MYMCRLLWWFDVKWGFLEGISFHLCCGKHLHKCGVSCWSILMHTCCMLIYTPWTNLWSCFFRSRGEPSGTSILKLPSPEGSSLCILIDITPTSLVILIRLPVDFILIIMWRYVLLQIYIFPHVLKSIHSPSWENI